MWHKAVNLQKTPISASYKQHLRLNDEWWIPDNEHMPRNKSCDDAKIDKRHDIIVRGARAKEPLLGLTSRSAMAAACLEEMNKVKAN